MADAGMIERYGFDPATDVDSVNEYFLKLLESLAEDKDLTLADFAEGFDSPAVMAHFNDHVTKEMIDSSCFALLCAVSVTTISKDVLNFFELTRELANDILIKGMSSIYLDVASKNRGNDAALLNAFSAQFDSLNEECIKRLENSMDTEAHMNKKFRVRYNGLTYAMEKVQEGDYDYLLDEVDGLIRNWEIFNLDKRIRGLFESEDYRETQKTPAAVAYPSQTLLDRCIIAMARILPKMYCGANSFFKLHSNPDAAVEAYMEARMARPSTMPAYASWTMDVVRSRTDRPWPRSTPRKAGFNPMNPGKPVAAAAATKTQKAEEAKPAEPTESFDLKACFEDMDKKKKRSLTIALLFCAIPGFMLGLMQQGFPFFGESGELFLLIGLIGSSVFNHKITKHVGWAIGLSIAFMIVSCFAMGILASILVN